MLEHDFILMTDTVTHVINQQELSVPAGTPPVAAARAAGSEMPALWESVWHR